MDKEFEKLDIQFKTFKAIEVSTTKISPKKFRIHLREYEWTGSVGIIRNDGPTMI